MTTAAAISPALKKAYEANIKRLYAFEFLDSFQLWIPIWAIYLIDDRGLSLFQVAVFSALFHIVVVFSEMPTGAVADRWGRKPSLLIGIVLYTLSIGLFGLASNFPLLLLSYLGWGLAHAFCSGADKAMVYDSLAGLGRQDQFSRVFGRSRAMGVGGAGMATLIGAPLATATSLTLPIFAGAAAMALSGIVCLGLTEPERNEKAPDLHYFQIVREAVRHTARQRSLRAMMMLYGVLSMAALIAFNFIQPFLTERDVATGDLGYFIFGAFALSVLGALVSHRLKLVVGEKGAFAGLTAVWACALLLLGVVPGLLAFAAFPVIYFCNSAFMPLESDFINRNSPQHLRATVLSVNSMAGSLAVFASLPLFGLVADGRSLQDSFGFAGLVLALLGGLAIFTWLSALRREHPHDEPGLALRAPALAD